MNEYYKTNSENQKQTKYACFVRTQLGMVPVGICESKAKAMGLLMLKMQDMFSEMEYPDENAELCMMFGGEEYAHGENWGDGFRIDGVCHGSDLNEPVCSVLGEAPEDDTDPNVHHLIGYALLMEEG